MKELVVNGRERKKKKKICRREKEGLIVVALPLVRRWVRGDDGPQASGDCGSGRRP
jgi:hypothetical protein